MNGTTSAGLFSGADPRFRRAATITFTALRIVAGLFYAQHGAQKLFGVLGGFGPTNSSVPLISQFGLAGVIEFFGGLLIALGLFTRPVAFVASGEMASAYFIVHWPRSFWPILNMGELPGLFCFIFLHFAALGAGPWSLDGLLRRRKG